VATFRAHDQDMTDTVAQTRTDPRPTWAVAVHTAKQVVAHVRPDDLGRSTPCDEFDVASLLGHMTSGMMRVEAVGAGTDPFAVPNVITDVAPDGWPTALGAQLDAASAAWDDDASLERVTTLPWVSADGWTMLPTYVAELTVHTWDLATALDIDVTWHPDAVAMADAAARALLPGGRREEMVLPNGMTVPFHSAVEVRSDASPIDHLVACYGRQP
jgi:uncharacterized protein (TIGR03086 family)